MFDFTFYGQNMNFSIKICLKNDSIFRVSTFFLVLIFTDQVQIQVRTVENRLPLISKATPRKC